MWKFDPERVRENVHGASTEDLLDRLTVDRAGMEAEALQIIEQELHERGVTPEQIGAHGAAREQQVITAPDGTAQKCSFCQRPAVEQRWGWQKLWGKLPVFPRLFYHCEEHRPEGTSPS